VVDSIGGAPQESGAAERRYAVAGEAGYPALGGGQAEPNADVSSDVCTGQPARYADNVTAELDRHSRYWQRIQRERKATLQAGYSLPCPACEELLANPGKALPRGLEHRKHCPYEQLLGIERRQAALVSRLLRQHPLWPWLAQFPGLGGAHMGLLLGRMADPWRFPGQRCSEGHYLRPVYQAGEPCPVVEHEAEIDWAGGDWTSEDAGAAVGPRAIDFGGGCPGVMLPPRDGTGVRSLWHYAGLHVEPNGRAPRRAKGEQGSWNPRLRASVMQPGGIAEQIVRHGIEPYVGIYRATKDRLKDRIPEARLESEVPSGDALRRAAVNRGGIDFRRGRPPRLDPSERSGEIDDLAGREVQRATDPLSESDTASGRPLRPFEADRIARKVAAKALLADLLRAWKLACPLSR
jgi:hypothetical protein